jgi:hypothetical protein
MDTTLRASFERSLVREHAGTEALREENAG